MEMLHDISNMPWCKHDWAYLEVNDETRELLKQCADTATKEDIALPEMKIIEKSKVFPIPFPIETVRLEQLKQRKPLERLRRNIASTYPLIHERVLLLMANFLAHKRQFGTSIERQYYESMSICELIDKMLKNRAVTFVGPYDKYRLLTGEVGASGWEEIGTSQEKPPLTLKNCLSYDEMKLSAMVYVSGYTECINNGTRKNNGVVEEDMAEEEAVIIGLVGTRFARRGKMDFEDILITADQNTPINGYAEVNSNCFDMFKSADAKDMQTRQHMLRQMWAEFYQIDNDTYESISPTVHKNAQKPYLERYFQVQSLKYAHPIFDNEAYYKRISIIAESTLLEADYRAKETKSKMAFVNVIGCGLGVWMVSGHQADVYVLTFLDRIRTLLDERSLDHVSDVNFAFILPSSDVLEIFSESKEGQGDAPGIEKFFMESEDHPKGGINVQMQNREPSSRLMGEHEGKLLVMTYPGDSNGHPGNEFWYGSLNSSGDPAAACSTQISELHNPHINSAVCANNVRVVGRHGLKTLSDYCLALTTLE